MATPSPVVPLFQPQLICNPKEKYIDHDVINKVSEMSDMFEKLLSKINRISDATDEKTFRAEENSAAQDISEIGPFGYLGSACTSGVATEEVQKYFVDTGKI